MCLYWLNLFCLNEQRIWIADKTWAQKILNLVIYQMLKCKFPGLIGCTLDICKQCWTIRETDSLKCLFWKQDYSNPESAQCLEADLKRYFVISSFSLGFFEIFDLQFLFFILLICNINFLDHIRDFSIYNFERFALHINWVTWTALWLNSLIFKFYSLTF